MIIHGIEYYLVILIPFYAPESAHEKLFSSPYSAALENTDNLAALSLSLIHI